MGIAFWRSALFFVVIAVFAVIIFPSQRELGKLYIESGSVGKATAYLGPYFHKYPHDTANTLRYFKGLLYFGNSVEFLKFARQMRDRYPEDLAYHGILADFYENNLQPQLASGEWLAMLRINPLQPEIKEKLVSYYELSKDTQGLVRFYSMQISQRAAGLEDYYDLGRLYSLNRDPSFAQRVYLEILKKFPGQDEARMRLAEAYEFSGNIPAAVNLYTQLYDSSPLNVDYALLLAEKLLRYDREERALDYLGRFLRRFRQDKGFTENLLYFYQAKAAGMDYLAEIEDFYRDNPHDSVILKFMAQGYFEANEYKKSEILLRSYNEKTGGDYRSHHLLGDVYSALGQPAAGRREYREALRLVREQTR
jgi:tetratricopeptide (TPR) repeat protein